VDDAATCLCFFKKNEKAAVAGSGWQQSFVYIRGTKISPWNTILASPLSSFMNSRRIELITQKFDTMVTSNELSLVLGLLASGLFYWKYRQYELQAEKEEMLNSFLE
jgi:hypothetical protein